MEKEICKVNTGNKVGYGYRIDEISFRIKTIFEIKDYLQSDLTFFNETKKIKDVDLIPKSEFIQKLKNIAKSSKESIVLDFIDRIQIKNEVTDLDEFTLLPIEKAENHKIELSNIEIEENSVKTENVSEPEYNQLKQVIKSFDTKYVTIITYINKTEHDDNEKIEYDVLPQSVIEKLLFVAEKNVMTLV